REALHLILEQAAALMGTPHGYLYLATPNRDTIRIDVGVGNFEKLVGTELSPNEGVAGRVWTSAMPINIADYQNWAGRSPVFTNSPFHAVVGIPLISGDKVTGVLGLGRLDAGDAFSDEDVELLSHFGQLASIAMENARLYSQAQQELVERTMI